MTGLADKLMRSFIAANPLHKEPFLKHLEEKLDAFTKDDGYTRRENLKELRERAYNLIDLMTDGTPEEHQTLKMAIVMQQMLKRDRQRAADLDLAVYPDESQTLMRQVIGGFGKPFVPAATQPLAQVQAISHIIDLEQAIRTTSLKGRKVTPGDEETALIATSEKIPGLAHFLDSRLLSLHRLTVRHFNNSIGVESAAEKIVSATPTIDGLRRLYDASAPFNEGTLKLDKIHTLAYQEFGNPGGIPVVYLHGGPGGGSAPFFHQMYDPKAFRIIIYDQRGCGKSTPHAETKNNTPDLLVDDLDKLRTHLGIDKWHVSGGSWGATLALLYAEEHPERVNSLTLRGIWLNRNSEIDWFINKMGAFIPEAFDEFKNHIPAKEQKDLLGAYYKRLMNPDPSVHMPAAHKWTRLENSGSFLQPLSDADKNETDAVALACARIEAHFFLKAKFENDNRILDNIGKIQHIPTTIIQGMYDIVCPPRTAHELKAALPNAEFKYLIAGHAASQPVITDAIMRAGDNIARKGSPLTPPPAPTPERYLRKF